MCLEVRESEVRESQDEGVESRRAGPERETILFVEDEAFVRKVTSEVLRSAGYRVLTASSAAEAVCVFDACRSELQLLLSDVVLPGETGRVLATKLRREKAELKVLLVTGYAAETAVLEEKHEECLMKPFSTVVLLRRVRQLLDGRGLLSETKDESKRVCGSG